MALKLGALLIKEKVITPRQLDEALKAQVTYGGRLGTNLVELGYLEEEALAYFLSEKLGVPYVNPRTLDNIAPKVIKLIPRDVAEKYQVVPVDAKEKRLRLAMSDPTNTRALDELAFVTDCVIKPMIAPEIHILHALEKYYGIPRDIRYPSISRKLDQPVTAEREGKAELHPLPEKETKEVPPSRTEEFVELVEKEPKDKVAEEIIEPTKRSYSFSEACRSLKTVEDRDEIAEIFLHYTLQFLERAALFIVKKHIIEGWNGKGENLTRELIQGVKIPFAVPSIFKKVIDSKKHYLGALPDHPVNEKFVSSMGGVNPRTVVLIPINIKDKPVCILYGDKLKEGGLKTAELGELLLLSNEVAGSFEMLILKFKKPSA